MIGEKISFLRTGRRYTQEYMAAKLGISQKSYSNIENNTKKPTYEELDIIAKELGVDKEYLTSPSPVIIINDAHHSANTIGNVSQQHNSIDKEILENLTRQLAQKDEQISKLTALLEKALKNI